MLKKFVGIIIGGAILGGSAISAFAAPDSDKVAELKALTTEHKTEVQTLMGKINEQQGLLKTIKSEIVKVTKDTPNASEVKEKNKEVRAELKKIYETNKPINDERKAMLEKAKVLHAEIKVLRNQYREAKKADDSVKANGLLDQINAKLKELNENTEKRIGYRITLVENIKNINK